MIEIDSVSCTNNSVIVINSVVHEDWGPIEFGKNEINDVPRIPVKTAPADTIAMVDARIEDVISLNFWRRK